MSMNRSNSLNEGRYLLFLDILGFSDLVETRPTKEIYDVIDSALNAFGRWEKLNGQFKTIYFSDTFLFYQAPKAMAIRHSWTSTPSTLWFCPRC